MKLHAGNRRRRTTGHLNKFQSIFVACVPVRAFVYVCGKIMRKFDRYGKISVEKSKSQREEPPGVGPLKIQTCHWDRMRVCVCKYPAEPAVGFKKPERHSRASSPVTSHWMLVVGRWTLADRWILGHGEGACQLQWGFRLGLAISLDKCAAGSLV